MGLTKVKNKLKKIGVDFHYEDADGFYDMDWTPLVCKLTFKDARGQEYEVSEHYKGRGSSKSVTFRKNHGYTQSEVCDWIDNNIELMTDLAALQKKEEARENARKEREYQSEIIDTKKFDYEGYHMTVQFIRAGYKRFSIKAPNQIRFTPTLRVEYDEFSKEKPFIEIQTTSYGAITAQEGLTLTMEWIKACNAATHFNKILAEEL